MQLEVGSILTGKVTSITKFGAFIDLGERKTGMVHISEISHTYVNEIREHLTEGQEVKVKVLSVGEDGKISLSIKKAVETPPAAPRQPRPAPRSAPRGGRGGFDPGRRNEDLSFEDMMSKFKKSSDEKMYTLKRSVESKRGSGGKRGAKLG
ncbi:MAG: S1 RNA-binding domain-containing protein [Acetanaerobacterium sp.]